MRRARDRTPSPWSDSAPIRADLFGVERLEQHARSLAAAQPVATRGAHRVPLPLHRRLDQNAGVLRKAALTNLGELRNGRTLAPAAEWLVDNDYIIDEQIREIRSQLPPGFYRQLPKLDEGPLAGYPRVFGIAWAYVAHTDSHFDRVVFERFVAAYQSVDALTIGELWATSITLRIVLVENLRRIADQIAAARAEEEAAIALTSRLAESSDARTVFDANVTANAMGVVPEGFAAQMARSLRDRDPMTTPTLAWLEGRLERQGTSIHAVVDQVQQREAAANVTVRNIITSMRAITNTDWADVFESVSLVDARLRRDSAFAAMDFPTRNRYRSAIEQLARGSSYSELEVATRAIARGRAAAQRHADPVEAARDGDPGYHLIADGRPDFEDALGFVAPLALRLGRFNVRLGLSGYLLSIALVTAFALVLIAAVVVGHAPSTAWLVAFLVAAALPASDAAVAVINRLVAASIAADPLPALELKDGIPSALRTLVVVPTMLVDAAEIRAQVERLEVHALSGSPGDVSFALLTDWTDAATESCDDDDALLAVAREEIAALNGRHPPGRHGPRFRLLHRRRVWSASEGCWMGWERKRGKLEELNRLLRGASDTHYLASDDEDFRVPPDVRYVITLDADTRLPRDAALRLVGKMAHPLNRPRFDVERRRVVDGYAILQPRVTPSLPLGASGSTFQRAYAGDAGMDPYAAAASDVYQDLFGEGSFTGKGIYDVDAFDAALAGRAPDGALLSHDLFEGTFARAGLASDVEVVEDFPSRYDVAAKRHHRWVRGDWQLLPWIANRWRDWRAPTAVGRWKMLDNLRRSLVAPATTIAVFLAWALPLPRTWAAQAAVLAPTLVVIFLPLVLGVFAVRRGVMLVSHARALRREARVALSQAALTIALLADRAWSNVDAIVRTLARVWVTRRHLLQWTTAAQVASSALPSVRGFYRQMRGGVAVVVVAAAVAIALDPRALAAALPLAALWLAAPLVARRVSSPARVPTARDLSIAERKALRLIGRRTWRYFETFVTPDERMLPPDNFQETPRPVVAHRTSPTNIGLYLLAAAVARDAGWAGTLATVERVEQLFATLRRLPRFNGHFFNWYATRDLRALEPQYVSTVDSGNFAGHLIAFANACEDWRLAPLAHDWRGGLRDALDLAVDAERAWRRLATDAAIVAPAEFDVLSAIVDGTEPIDAIEPRIAASCAAVRRELDARVAVDGEDDTAVDMRFWIDALAGAAASHRRDHAARATFATELAARLFALAAEARGFAREMDFAFLVDPERKLLSIGYSLADNRLDRNCYDLLASEARLASLFAIAKGDVPTRHWFHLGRASVPVADGSALVSWAGSMFEYLMPSLVMRAPRGSLLEQTNRLVVHRQRTYAASRQVPWGISESAFNARDIEFTYQYSTFGVPGLGLKRGLADNLVVAPYATALASMVDPRAALENLATLVDHSAQGRYGFYDALDFTRSRVREGSTAALVRNFMAHHQGMSIVAIANVLDDGRMRERFHREPMIHATELLLQERMPRDVSTPRLPLRQSSAATPQPDDEVSSTLRRVDLASSGPPVTHLLSRGRYTVMLTAAGGGFSRWGDLAVTRWREDATCDADGSFVFLRDLQSGEVWSAAGPHLPQDEGAGEAVFAEDRAAFLRRDGRLLTTMDVLVSGEDDGEVRRVSLVNRGRRPREIELTTYAELVLTSPSTDNAHPAFAKMFVQTEFVPEFDALAATRRRRSPDEPDMWVAHFGVVDGETIAPLRYETDRARFLGRGRSIGDAAAIGPDGELSNTVGTVLDPIVSLRYRVRVPPGGTVKVDFWTLVASSREALVDVIDRHHSSNAFERAATFAWTQSQVQLRHLGIQPGEAADFQRLAAPILYADGRFRPASDVIVRGAGRQSGLWGQSISGDLPILLVRIDEVDELALVTQLLRAHEYWRSKRLEVDLVFLNERAASYVQDLQVAIDTAIRSSQARPRIDESSTRGGVFALRADLLPPETRALLIAAARVVLVARRGTLSAQLEAVPDAPRHRARRRVPVESLDAADARPARAPEETLEFFNGLGGFAHGGGEYVTRLRAGRTTPAPWINVVTNASFGFHASTEGSGFTWAVNSRENQLTPWSNDPVRDPAGEAFYIRDDDTGAVWSPTAQPVRDDGLYVARHGFGYCRFDHDAHGIAAELLQYVPLDDSVKLSRLTLRNRSGRPRNLSVTSFAEWVLGTSRGANAAFIASEADESGALFARNPWSPVFSGRVAFADMGGRQTSWTADRSEFLGWRGTKAWPAALSTSTPLSGRTGAGFDPCAALRRTIVLAPGQSIEIVHVLGQADTMDEARALVARYRKADLDAALSRVVAHWEALLSSVQVKTPDRAFDLMVNGWLLYQAAACRVWARSAFYQASGAYGFRDQLQDGMALTFARPAETRAHLLRAASRQFPEGDVQHWWLPHSGEGVRTHISDDRVWLAYAAATYVRVSGDDGVLDAQVPFIEGRAVEAGKHDAFYRPEVSAETASLFEHCARGLDDCIRLTGAHGLPLMGTGDWNDGMNRVGQEGRGESVWLAWLFARTVALFAPHAATRDPARHARWIAHADSVVRAIERDAWDGAWYRRATFDDGSWLGSSANDECRIDSIAQTWSVLSRVADPARAKQAMASLDERLVHARDGLVLLFSPPFDRTARDPGYIKGYPPGLRENGGQYSHAAMWTVFAHAANGDADRAVELFALLNPVNHALNATAVQRYKVEPYVVAADVYSVAPHTGRGGWTWYTGSAAWMYRAGVEAILGITREGDTLVVAPRLPRAWPRYEATVSLADGVHTIVVVRAADGAAARATIDDVDVAFDGDALRVPLAAGTHRVELTV